MKLNFIAICATVVTTNCFIYAAQSPVETTEIINTASNTIQQTSIPQKLSPTAHSITQSMLMLIKKHPAYAVLGSTALLIAVAYITVPAFKRLVQQHLGLETSDNNFSEKFSLTVTDSPSADDPLAEHILPAQKIPKN